MMKNLKKILVLVLVLVMALSFAACGPKTNDVDAGDDVTTLGEGATSFTFIVVDQEQNQTDYVINTDEQTVGAALLAVDLISGTDSQYGLYVDTVQGIKLDYDATGEYWAFYINGEYAMTGVDSTDVEADATYSFVAEKYE